MDSREAKDFIVQQTLQQAALDGVPVSDLEKRMMYFTESADAVEDPSTSMPNLQRSAIPWFSKGRLPR